VPGLGRTNRDSASLAGRGINAKIKLNRIKIIVVLCRNILYFLVQRS
jgi:hypothetical protein